MHVGEYVEKLLICLSDPFSTLQCPALCPESLSWRDCLDRNAFTSAFQQRTPAEGKEGRREDSEIGAGYNLQPKVITSLKVACFT